MDTTTLQQLEKMREDSRALDRQTKSLPVILSITFLPIIFICAWVAFPEDKVGVIFVGKLWVAGILVGLMLCSYLSSALGQAIKSYSAGLLCGLIVCIPPIIATSAHAEFGLRLVQWSVTAGVLSCGIGLYLYLLRTGSNKLNFNAHYIRSLLALLVLYAQLQAGIAVAHHFPHSIGGQIAVCASYPFVAALFRRISVSITPRSGSISSEILSIYFASMTYRILTIFYYQSWGAFLSILGLDILFKWIFYSVQLSDKYLNAKTKLQFAGKRFCYCLPSKLQRFLNLGEAEDSEDLIPIPIASEHTIHHKNVTFLFFLQTHADIFLSLGLAVVQLVSMKFNNAENCFSDWFADYLTITWKYAIVASVQIINMIAFYFFANKALKKTHFSPVAEGTSNISAHHLKLLFTNTALFLVVFILFFHSYGGKSVYCSE